MDSTRSETKPRVPILTFVYLFKGRKSLECEVIPL